MTDRSVRVAVRPSVTPVRMMALVDIIRGLATSDNTAALAAEFVKRIGKTAREAEDAPGFIVNRILCPMINEAIFALGEGIGTVESIDAGMKLGANHPMGPLTLADFVGLDTRSEEHTSELQSLMRISYAVFCLKKKKKNYRQ